MTASGTISLVIAVTGHRDPVAEDVPGLEAEIGGIFEELRSQYPHTPLLLLSGLAEGADRIAVRAAIQAKVPYIAVMPMPVDLYRQDFTTADSDAEFMQLRVGAERCIELPLASGATVEPGSHTRDRQYECLGRFLVQYSQILIAVWDQDRAMKTGGTSHVVAMKLREESSAGRLVFSRMNTNGAGPVYVVAARRSGAGTTTRPALRREIRYPLESAGEEYAASYRLLDRFNSDAARIATESRGNPLGSQQAVGLSPAMEWAATVYARADALAIHFATASLQLWKAVFLLLAASGVALTGVHAMNGGTPFLAAYYGFLGAACALIAWEWKTRRRGRHEDYRALAEALRVQFFWMAAGLPDMAADQYLRKQSGEMVWIRDAMIGCALFEGVLDRAPGPVRDFASRLRFAQTWVTEQAGYFLKTKEKHERKKRRLTVFATAAVAVGLIAPLVALMEPFAEAGHAVAAIALWWAALAWNYVERRGFAQEARQYARMYHLFHTAGEDLERFERENNFRAAEQTIRELGCEALTENGDWLAMHRERKLSIALAAG